MTCQCFEKCPCCCGVRAVGFEQLFDAPQEARLVSTRGFFYCCGVCSGGFEQLFDAPQGARLLVRENFFFSPEGGFFNYILLKIPILQLEWRWVGGPKGTKWPGRPWPPWRRPWGRPWRPWGGTRGLGGRKGSPSLAPGLGPGRRPWSGSRRRRAAHPG